MKDRQSTQVLANGAIRYAVYNASSQLQRYDYLLPADSPTEVGTPINKATLLKDTTASLLGGDPNVMLPDDALNVIISSINAKIISGSYAGDGSRNRIITLGFTPIAVLVMSARGEVGPYGGLAVPGVIVTISGMSNTTWDNQYSILGIVDGGFMVNHYIVGNATYAATNVGPTASYPSTLPLIYTYIAIKQEIK